MQHILVTGGAGFIGSHTVMELAGAGFKPVILDNFRNAERSVLPALEQLLGEPVVHYEGDYQDAELLSKIVTEQAIDGVIHFAAHKAVAESVEQPLLYYQNNVAGFVRLLDTLQQHNVRHFVFSSSAAVYGTPPVEQVTEATVCDPESPYGWSKYMDEIILRDACRADKQLKGIALRYFNVVGSHDSAKIGELPKGKPQNLLPIIVQAVAGKIPPLTVYGTDYPTPDGTCLRDYVHVVDLARAHVAALNKLVHDSAGLYEVYNIGTGKPTSVLELIQTFERVNEVKVPHILGERRAGDPAAYCAVADKAARELGWQAENTIEDAVRSAWAWQQTLNTVKE